MKLLPIGLMGLMICLSVETDAQTICESASMIALRTDIMVHALSCGNTSSYNGFIYRNRPALAKAERNVMKDFQGSAKGIAGYDTWITELSNERSNYSMTQGDDYCPEAQIFFKQIVPIKTISALLKMAVKQNISYSPTPACPLSKSVSEPAKADIPSSYPEISVSKVMGK